MKASTAGARHLAASANWLAWRVGLLAPGLVGTFMQSAMAHWDDSRFADFLAWRRGLPC